MVSNDDEEFPSGEAFQQAWRDQHVNGRYQAIMEVMEFRMSVTRLMDELKTDQLITLNRMLGTVANDPGSAQFLTGQISTLLRIVHKVCSNCGNNDHSAEAHDFTEAARNGDLGGGGARRAPSAPWSDIAHAVTFADIVIDTEGPSTVSQEELDEYNVQVDSHSYICKGGCSTAWASMTLRREVGVACPGCAGVTSGNAENK